MLRYRLRSITEQPGTNYVLYDIICTTLGRSKEDLDALREGLGQLIGVTFVGAYSLSYNVNEVGIDDVLPDIREACRWWTEIRRDEDRNGNLGRFNRRANWSLIIDLMRRLTVPMTIELCCTAYTGDSEERPAPIEPNVVTAVEDSELAARLFQDMGSDDVFDFRRLTVRVLIGGDEVLSPGVIETVGIELVGAGAFSALEGNSYAQKQHDREVLQARFSMSPVESLKVFRLPLGSLYPGVSKPLPLDLATTEDEFPSTGILLGAARRRHARADEEIEVRLAQADRLRHMYVIGKTGTGKTNLLKGMASQDVKVVGRGVTIIDPHGDLVDYVLREIPKRRLRDVTLIDLARTDAVPVLNPLDIDRNDVTTRDRTIQELIWLMRSRVYHQFTGPRFDELVRLTFQTVLDEGYPEAPSFVEVPRLLMDRHVQGAVRKLIRDEEVTRRWEFDETLMRDPEYGGLIHYVTSKFDDIARDSTLRRVLGGGRSTLNIEQIVRRGGILLVRIPEAIIGKQAADFIGSLVLLQLRMAIIRRRQSGKSQKYHFVYVDEFQNFANTDFHTLVAEARKFNIGFTLANQNLEQLREFRSYTGYHDERLISSILGNVGSLIAFGVGTYDANALSAHFEVSPGGMLRIGRFEALAKLLVNGFDTSALTLKVREAVGLESPSNLEEIEKRMRESCWVDARALDQEVEGRLNRVISMSAVGVAKPTGRMRGYSGSEIDDLEDEGEGAAADSSIDDTDRDEELDDEQERSFNVSFPIGEDDTLAKISYELVDSMLKIIATPGEAGLRFVKRDVRFTKGTAYKTLEPGILPTARRRPGNDRKRLVITVPYEDDSIHKVSYVLENGFVTIIYRPGEAGLGFERADVKFTREVAPPPGSKAESGEDD